MNTTPRYCAENILLIQLGDIGDVVLATPALRAVKEAYPNAHVSILVFKPYGSLLAGDPNIFEVVETKKIRGSMFRLLRESVAFARHLRQKHYDLVIDLRTGDRGAILSFLTGAPARIGYRGGNGAFWLRVAFTEILRDLDAASRPVHPGADQSLRLLRKLGIDTADSTPRLYPSPEDRLQAHALLAKAGVASGTRIATINPFSRWKYKEWDNNKWAAVIDRLWEERRIPAVLIGASEEAAACQEIVEGRKDHAFNLAGKTTLNELAALISISSLHLGVDSAAPHIAAAVETPTVTIHGPSDWRAWRIVNDKHRVVSAAMDCIPCSKTGCDGSGQSKCLDELGADPVVRVALEILESITPSGL